MDYQSTGACFSRDRKHRYRLWRVWDDSKPFLVVIMLNPSKANETRDDPTVARMIKRAQAMKFGGLVVLNIFALVSTDPRKLYRYPDPVGKYNDQHIATAAPKADMVICGWGKRGALSDRGTRVAQMLRRQGIKLHALFINADGSPRHPLYLSYATQPVEFP